MSWIDQLKDKRHRLAVLTAVYAIYWLVLVMDYVWWRLLPGLEDWQLLFFSLETPEMTPGVIAGLAFGAIHIAVFSVVPIICIVWIRRVRNKNILLRSGVCSLSFVAMWHWSTFVADQWLGLYWLLGVLWWAGMIGTFLIGLAWAVWIVERASQYFRRLHLDSPPPQPVSDPRQLQWPKAIGGLTIFWGFTLLVASGFELFSAYQVWTGADELRVLNFHYVALGSQYFLYTGTLAFLGLCMAIAGIIVMRRSDLSQAVAIGAAATVLLLLIAMGTVVTFLMWQVPESRDPMDLASALILEQVVHIFFWGAMPVFLLIWFTRKKIIACVAGWNNKIADAAVYQSAEQAGYPPGQSAPAAGGFQYMPDVWNPFDLEAWYYGIRQRKVNQSLTTLFSYALLFLLVFWLITQMAGCMEIYEMPAGGGKPKQKVQVVKVQKVKKLKFIINPLSVVVFNPPPIDEIKLKLKEVSKHMYEVGYGKGKGAGFSAGTNRGKVRFIRLEYSGGDWDLAMGHDSDLLMLLKYFEYTGHKIHNRTESRTVAQLKNFPVGKSPPMVYLTGQKNIYMSKSEQKILHEYIIEKHGMIFCSNGGSRHFHNQFFGLMRRILPNVQPVRVPLDDVIHRVPFDIPFLPYVAPHGGKDAWGWKVDGRWVAYYHPGDIGDAWSKDHAGVKPQIAEYCYQLGTNVIFYAHAEYNKWLEARKKE